MTKNKICEIATIYFPGYAVAMLTGSQAGRNEIDATKDMDVLLFHPVVGKKMYKNITHEGFVFDFNMLPLCDVENVINNESSDVSGTILSMLSKGTKLHDPMGIATEIKGMAQKLYEMVSPRTRQKYKQLTQDLARMKRLANTNLGKNEQVFLVCETISAVVATETIHLHQWLPSIKHRSRILNDKNRVFSDKLAAIAKASITGGSVKPLGDFLEGYTLSLNKTTAQLPIVINTIVFDIYFDGLAVEEFERAVIIPILNEPRLRKHYQYYYFSPINYWPTYQNKVCLQFHIDNPENIFELENNLQTAIDAKKVKDFEIGIIYPNQKGVNKIFSEAIEALIINLCQLHSEILGKEDYLEERFLTAAQLCIFLIKELKLGKDDFENANLFLLQRFLLTAKEQQEATSYALIVRYNNTKSKELALSFNKTKLEVLSAMAGVLQNEDSFSVSSFKKQVLGQLKSIAINKNNYEPTQLYQLAILGFYKIVNTKDVFVYTTIAEQVLQMLNLSTEQKKECLFALSQAPKYY